MTNSTLTQFMPGRISPWPSLHWFSSCQEGSVHDQLYTHSVYARKDQSMTNSTLTQFIPGRISPWPSLHWLCSCQEGSVLLYSAWWSLNRNICYFFLEQFELIARYKDNQVKSVTLQHILNIATLCASLSCYCGLPMQTMWEEKWFSCRQKSP